ncbi:MAG: C-type lectin domain-containing protein [Actinomycetota bacterium]|nr:C-type lectin domain-containing protein [Actinomycetota bacterium]
MKTTIYIPLTLALSVSGCSEYGLQKAPNDLPPGAEEPQEATAEEDDDEFQVEEVDILPPVIEQTEEPEEEVEEPEEEPCGGPDDDCDLDGYTPNQNDCDDTNPMIHPFAGDTYGDEVDQDCDMLDCEADASGDTYYAFCPDERLNWEDSFDLCVEHGYDSLAAVYDEHSQTALNLLLQDSRLDDQESPWIDMNPVGDSLWGSGDPVVYTNWAEGEPNGGADFCGQINRDFDGNGFWNDVPCDDTIWSLTCQVSM